MKQRKINVCIADDHLEISLGIEAMLQNEKDINIVGMPRSKPELEEWFNTSSNQADVLLLDINMPNPEDGLAACKFIREKYSYTKILSYSSHESIYWIQKMKDLGAYGFIVKGSDPKVIKHAIREAKNGRKSFHHSLLKKIEEQKEIQKTADDLTRREKEVLILITRGQKNEKMAEELGIAVSTIKTHRQHLNLKIGSDNTIDHINFAKKIGLIHI
ncbi:MAG: DNA-binding NarL/FixJ family response regulator [Flammeovirgaceae bacterium]|jgi:DNA-binding NarL/FixJ family response regulator